MSINTYNAHFRMNPYHSGLLDPDPFFHNTDPHQNYLDNNNFTANNSQSVYFLAP